MSDRAMYNNFIMYDDGKDAFKMWQGLKGPYFTPSVDDVGNLSWTNNGGLSNPATVNINGRGLKIVGIVSTTSELPESISEYDCYLVGSEGDYDAYIYADGTWTDVGPVGRGDKGDTGDDGFSPVVSVSTISGGHSVSVTDAEGTETFNVMDGINGEGVASGGTTGQVLKKKSNTNYDTEWGSVEALPTGGTTGQVLAKKTNTNFDVEWITQSSGTVQSVNSVTPDQNGNILLDADDIGTDSNGISVQDAIDDYVHIGTSAPTDPTTKIWLDTDEPGMSVVSSVNGKTGTVVLDADDVGAMSVTLLWTNSSPTSNFAEQTIEVDATAYDLYLIVFWRSNTDSSNRICSVIMPKGYGSLVQNIDASRFVYRTVTVSTNPVGFNFASGFKINTYAATSAATDNSFMIPIFIYGINT